MGGMRFGRPTDGSGRKPPNREMLEELIRLAESKKPVSEENLVGYVQAFGEERSRQREELKLTESYIREVYSCFSPAQRVRFFAMLYDQFAENYDRHMGIETRHYEAIRRTLMFAMPYLRLPIIDLTAGTGEPLKYALEFMDVGRTLTGGALGRFAPPTHLFPLELEFPAYANEISSRMMERAKTKLAGKGVGFASGNAFELPGEFRGRFNTVLCSQTFHLISDDDKTLLVRSIRDALTPGGKAVVLEEDPFRITQTEFIEPLSLFLRAIVRPIKYPEKLDVYFTTNGFILIDETASAGIDSEHAMRLHIFTKG